jgi:hypothetical protein
VIDASWIMKWRNFISGSEPNAPYPGPVQNRDIAEFIMKYRFNKKHYLHDNSLVLEEPQQVYVLSKSFFDLFGDRYGIDVVIQIVKYNHIEDLM